LICSSSWSLALRFWSITSVRTVWKRCTFPKLAFRILNPIPQNICHLNTVYEMLFQISRGKLFRRFSMGKESWPETL
jgi:hypothetical protein